MASKPCLYLCFAAAAVLCATAHGKKFEVGPGKAYTAPSAVASLVKDGDTVEIAPGVYPADVATWRANNLVLRATARYAHLRADGAHAGGKGIWVFAGNNITAENIEFSGAKVPDENGAGIRAEGRSPTIRNCYFHDNENGILGGSGESDVLIENSEFNNNGFGDGFTHNMYIGPVRSLTLRGSFTHHAKIGHNVKSRARINHILYNRITDDADGTASYSIDLPNGGLAVIIGNLIQQSPRSDNPSLFAWGAEGLTGTDNRVYLSHNTFVNDMSKGTFISLSGTPTVAKAMNNLFVGPGTFSNAKLDTAGNVTTLSPAFVDRANFDYRLTAASPAVDKGKDPGMADSLSLSPTLQYLPPHGTLSRPTVGPRDAGAFEFQEGMGLRPDSPAPKRVKGRKGATLHRAHPGLILSAETPAGFLLLSITGRIL